MSASHACKTCSPAGSWEFWELPAGSCEYPAQTTPAAALAGHPAGSSHGSRAAVAVGAAAGNLLSLQ